MAESLSRNPDIHVGRRLAWLRAAVLGANDGIISTASLLMGVAAANVDRTPLLLAGLAGLVGGALSMASGEFVSVSSQKDAEAADLERERMELLTGPHLELEELVRIYRRRGLDLETATTAARQMMAHDALGTHARDELGINPHSAAHPVQAAIASALTFAFGAALPLLVASLAPPGRTSGLVAATVLPSLMLLGWFGAHAGKAPVLPAVLRAALFGGAAMAATWWIGRLAGNLL